VAGGPAEGLDLDGVAGAGEETAKEDGAGIGEEAGVLPGAHTINASGCSSYGFDPKAVHHFP